MTGAFLVVLVPRRALGDVIVERVEMRATVSCARVPIRTTQPPMTKPRTRAKDSHLLALFGRAGGNLRLVGELLDQLLDGWPDGQELRQQILQCEHTGDRITHDLIHQLHTASPRTFDREDLFNLAVALDNVIDFAEEVADYLGLYQIEAPMEGAQQLAGVLHQACSCLATALEGLSDVPSLSPLLTEIHRLEHEGDRIVRGAIASLFVGGVDPMVVIRWKDLFERLEDAVDSCDAAAHILEGIVVKHA